MNYIYIAQVVVIAMFLLSSVLKLGRASIMLRHWNEYRYPIWFMKATAILELSGAFCLLLALWIPILLKPAAALLAILMVGAVHAHIYRAKQNPIKSINALLMLVLAIWILLS